MRLFKKTTTVVTLLTTLLSMSAIAAQIATPVATPVATVPIATMVTNLGTIEIELNPEKAPVTTKNFIAYADKGFYNDTIFHRVIPDFMVQGGGFYLKKKDKSTKEDMIQKNTDAPIANESANGLKNMFGTISMARTNNPDSATSQFFINLTNNTFLDGSNKKPGYTVFGKVIKGMDVVAQIASKPTGRKGMHSNVPEETILIKSVTVNIKPAQEKQEKSTTAK